MTHEELIDKARVAAMKVWALLENDQQAQALLVEMQDAYEQLVGDD